MKDIYYNFIYPYQKYIRLKKFILQSTIVNHLIQLMIKYVWEMADLSISTTMVNWKYIIY